MEQPRAIVEEQDAHIADLKATVKEQDETTVYMKDGHKQQEDIGAFQDMIVAKERELAQRFGSDRNLELYAPFNGKGGMKMILRFRLTEGWWT